VQDGLQIQAYVDPGTPGRTNQLHVTAFDADGQELPLRSATISLGPPQGEATTPDLVRFGPGHFVANFDLTPGRWTFAITAEARDGRSLIASFARTFGS
jgi:nitrogen fixation protein FixH